MPSVPKSTRSALWETLREQRGFATGLRDFHAIATRTIANVQRTFLVVVAPKAKWSSIQSIIKPIDKIVLLVFVKKELSEEPHLLEAVSQTTKFFTTIVPTKNIRLETAITTDNVAGQIADFSETVRADYVLGTQHKATVLSIPPRQVHHHRAIPSSKIFLGTTPAVARKVPAAEELKKALGSPREPAGGDSKQTPTGNKWLVVLRSTRVTKDGNLLDSATKETFDLANENDEIMVVYFDDKFEGGSLSDTPIGRLTMQSFELALKRYVAQQTHKFVPASFKIRVRDGLLANAVLQSAEELEADFVVAAVDQLETYVDGQDIQRSGLDKVIHAKRSFHFVLTQNSKFKETRRQRRNAIVNKNAAKDQLENCLTSYKPILERQAHVQALEQEERESIQARFYKKRTALGMPDL